MKCRILLLLSLTLFLSFYLSAQQFNFIQYSISEGLPQSQVDAIFEDSKGYIWLGTQGGGISRFDGKDFQNYSKKDGLPSAFIQAIFEDESQTIWVATKQGIARFKHNEFELINNGVTNANCFIQQNDSIIWLGTEKGMYGLNAVTTEIQQIQFNRDLDESSISNLIQSDIGIWAATDDGAWLISDSLRHFKNPSQRMNSNLITGITKSNDGHFWIFSFDGDITRIDGKSKKILSQERNINLSRSTCAFTADNGKIWLGSQNNGLYIFSHEEQSWTNVNEQNGLPHNYIKINP